MAEVVEKRLDVCQHIGSGSCTPDHYEKIVGSLHPSVGEGHYRLRNPILLLFQP